MVYNRKFYKKEMSRFYLVAVIALLLILGLLTYQILKPFLTPIAWAIVFSIIFYPVYAFTHKYIKWKSVAALLTLTIILVVILGPFSYLTYLLVSELKDLTGYLEADKIVSVFNLTEDELNQTIIDNISKLGKEMVGRITKGATNVVTISLDFIFMVFSIFFFLR